MTFKILEWRNILFFVTLLSHRSNTLLYFNLHFMKPETEKTPDTVIKHQKTLLCSAKTQTKINLLLNWVISTATCALWFTSFSSVSEISPKTQEEVMVQMGLSLWSLFMLIASFEFIVNTLLNANLLRRLSAHGKVLKNWRTLTSEEEKDLHEVIWWL